MEEHFIDFTNIEWTVPEPGVRYKASIQGNQKLRLVEYTEQVDFPKWCQLAHIGYVLEGTMVLDFGEHKVEYHAGDGIFVSEGTKHKPHVPHGQKAVVIFVEKP